MRQTGLLRTEAEHLFWIKAVGFRALPPVEGPALVIASYDIDAANDFYA
jgi:hypothetical protein